MGSADEAKRRLTGRQFRRAQRFLETEDTDAWKVSTRTDHLMAQVAYYVYSLDLSVRSMFASSPVKADREFKDFLLEIGQTTKPRKQEAWELVDPNEPDLDPLQKRYIEFRRKYASKTQAELDNIESEMRQKMYARELGAKMETAE